ncbi:MAG TPA: ATP-grasp domain-containing protein, partial [Chthoniobacterales bacterium]|nr:ATP-grasp domain-containing protein [Chthoniobacterales bacterium]
MNIHEYQAKQLFERFNVATPKGRPADTPEEAEKIAASLDTSDLVVKAQIHAGGRGKGTFTNGFKGGVKLCKTPAEAREIAEKMLGQTLVTHQTGPAGRLVRKVLVAQSVEIEQDRLVRRRVAKLMEANEALRGCLDAIALVPEVDDFLGQVMAATTRQLNASSSALFLRNDESNFLILDLVFQDGRVLTPAEASFPEKLRSVRLG